MPKVWTKAMILYFCSAIQALWLHFLTGNFAFFERFLTLWAYFRILVIVSEA